jgi:ribosomal protein S18 acetylase RimI-like enzyme
VSMTCETPAGVIGASVLRPDEWLTSILGKPAYALTIPDCEADALRMSSDLPAGAFIYTRLDATDSARIKIAEQCLEMTLTDTNVLLEQHPGAHHTPPSNRVRLASPDDESAVAKVAATSFSLTRFHADPQIGPDIANRIKAQWARNFFNGHRGELMLVAEHADRIAGFCQLLHREDALIIDLIAVSAAARRQGLASDMIAASRIAARERGCQWLRVGTQLANIASLRCYEGLGFRVCSAQHIFHRHTPA